MLALLYRLVAEMGPAVVWIFGLVAAVVVAFTVYLGVAMVATLRATDPEQGKIRYRVFRDLLRVFERGRR